MAAVGNFGKAPDVPNAPPDWGKPTALGTVLIQARSARVWIKGDPPVGEHRIAITNRRE